MRNRFLFFTFFWCALAGAQPSRDLAFIDHLTIRNRNSQALRLLHFERSMLSRDTADYLIGLQHHLLKNTDSAAHYFAGIPSQGGYFPHARFFGTLNLMYRKNYAEAERFISVLSPSDTATAELKKLVLGGNYLLQRDYSHFDSISATFGFRHFTSTAEQEYLRRVRTDMVNSRKKSPALAGLLSAAVPGLGKFYAGRKGAALAAFMSNLVLAGIAYEAYYRSGAGSPQFIAAGTVFGAFYAGNIVGSVYSVKQQQRSLNGKINNEILATIHIPVNRLFLR